MLAVTVSVIWSRSYALLSADVKVFTTYREEIYGQ